MISALISEDNSPSLVSEGTRIPFLSPTSMSYALRN